MYFNTNLVGTLSPTADGTREVFVRPLFVRNGRLTAGSGRSVADEVM